MMYQNKVNVIEGKKNDKKVIEIKFSIAKIIFVFC